MLGLTILAVTDTESRVVVGSCCTLHEGVLSACCETLFCCAPQPLSLPLCLAAALYEFSLDRIGLLTELLRSLHVAADEASGEGARGGVFELDSPPLASASACMRFVTPLDMLRLSSSAASGPPCEGVKTDCERACAEGIAGIGGGDDVSDDPSNFSDDRRMLIDRTDGLLSEPIDCALGLLEKDGAIGDRAMVTGFA